MTKYKLGEKIELVKDSEYFQVKRVTLVSSEENAKIKVLGYIGDVIFADGRTYAIDVEWAEDKMP